MKITPSLLRELYDRQRQNPAGMEAGLKEVLDYLFVVLATENQSLRGQLHAWEAARMSPMHGTSLERLRNVAKDDELVHFYLRAFEAGKIFFLEEALVQIVLKLAEQLKLAGQEIERLQADVYVPGVWKCNECGLRIFKQILYTQSGTVGVSEKEELEECINDGMLMVRVTWKEEAEGDRKFALKLSDAIKKHHDARGHDRCWENDNELYVAAGLLKATPELPEKSEFLRRCNEYYEQQAEHHAGVRESFTSDLGNWFDATESERGNESSK